MSDEVEGSHPRLIIYSNGRLVGVVEGYFDDADMDNFTNRINALITD